MQCTRVVGASREVKRERGAGACAPSRGCPPEHAARAALSVTQVSSWLIEPRLYLFSERFSNRLSPCACLDLYSDYRTDAICRVFARLDNAADTRYQEVFNYGTSGRALYGGFSARW